MGSDVTEIFKTPGKLRGKTPRTARKQNPLENRQVYRSMIKFRGRADFPKPLTDVFSTNARMGPSPSRGVKPPDTVTSAAPTAVFSPIKPEASKANTDSGYHGMSEDEMDTDHGQVDAASSIQVLDGTQEPAYICPSLPGTRGDSCPHTERAPTTEGSFHSAREELVESEDVKVFSQGTVQVTETQSLNGLPEKAQSKPPPSTAPLTVQADVMRIDEAEEGSMLGDPIDESRSPSQGSSPVKHLVRKSSLTFAALPAREPLTTKKSISATRISHVDQANNALSRGSFLGRFTSGKSLGGARQTEAENGEDDVNLEEPLRLRLDREEADGDAKLAKHHNKSSTQRLHDKITMLGKSQPARPTKSIPATAVSTSAHYPELPQVDVQAHPAQPSPQSPEPVAKPTDDEDDDWIKPPPVQSNQVSRPQLSKSTTMDVMEDIRGKQNVGDKDFEPGYYDEDAFKLSSVRSDIMVDLSTSVAGPTRSASAAVLAPPSRTQANAENNRHEQNSTSVAPLESRKHFATSTTPAGTPRSKQNVDGPLSASKSKLQSIMKTARGLFTSSAGVSAQAKIEALSSPSTRTRNKMQDYDLSDVTQGTPKNENQKKVDQPVSVSKSPQKQPEGRRTRSSTEKEEKRKVEEEVLNAASKEVAKPEAIELTNRPSKPTRQSPRRPRQQAEDDEERPSNVNAVGSETSMEPPQSQTSQLQRPKDSRRPMKPAKEAASKPKPQIIRVGPLSNSRMPLSNAALSSSLQESLPAAHTRPPGPVKKASNASIQTSASNSSLKSSATSVAAKPKALLAAERKKEQVSSVHSPLCLRVLIVYRMRGRRNESLNKSVRSSEGEPHSRKSNDSKNACSVRSQIDKGSESDQRQ